MKLKADRATLIKALAHVQSVVERRNTIPILANVMIAVRDGKLTLTATDMEIAIVEDVTATSSRNGACTAPASTLYEIVRKLPDGAEVEFDHPGGDGQLALRAGRFAQPRQSNGLVLDPAEKVLFVAMTRDNAVWRMPLMKDGGVAKVGRFCSTFGPSGPDGLTMDRVGRLFVAHASLGHVFVFAPNGELIARIKSCAGPSCTNVAIGGVDRDRLYITESVTGTVMVADIGELR